jgi:CHAT domain-containing protein
LIEDYRIAQMMIPRRLPRIVQPHEGQSTEQVSLLLVGDIDFDTSPDSPESAEVAHAVRRSAVRGGAPQRFGRLSGTRREIAAVRQVFQTSFPDGISTVLRDRHATEAALRGRMGQHNFVLLATHGFFSPADAGGTHSAGTPELELFRSARDVVGFNPGLMSGIALTGANPSDEPGRTATVDDGILTATELTGMDLSDVELVVLSACETALGSGFTGEGVIGLQRAFEAAGTRTTITSLWKVHDDATQALMTTFFRNLWKKRMRKLDAFRAAQLEMLRGYDPTGEKLRGAKRLDSIDVTVSRTPPAFWSGFVLSGDWR